MLQNILGEVYNLDDAALSNFDHLEQYPGYYSRDSIQVTYLTDRNDADISTQKIQEQCMAYILHDFKPQVLDLPHLESFDCKLVEYTPPDQRPKQNHPQDHWWDVKNKPKQ